MLYKEFLGERVSALGMGCMRLPFDEKGEIDIEKTKEMIDLCVEGGVNYFDTAWFYHDGRSEEVIGRLLKRHPRDKYFFVTKMPWSELKQKGDPQWVFEEQLKRTGMEYFDFYLFHNVCESNIETYFNEEIGAFDYLVKQKRNGRIRHLGFSTHGSLATMERFIKKYASEIEFCQIQLNWLDWTLQDAKGKVELLKKYNLPIVVMEPLRGGKLAVLEDCDEMKLKALRADEKIPAWSFRFLQSVESVKVVLSGMSDKAQVEENIETFLHSRPLVEKEKNALLEIADRILSKKTLTCTGCKYCVSECPSGLDIPKLLRLFNDMCLVKNTPLPEKVRLNTEKLPAECIGCRRCETKCPQGILISEIMKDFAQRLAAVEP